jgi:hypothetical protein
MGKKAMGDAKGPSGGPLCWMVEDVGKLFQVSG